MEKKNRYEGGSEVTNDIVNLLIVAIDDQLRLNKNFEVKKKYVSNIDVFYIFAWHCYAKK